MFRQDSAVFRVMQSFGVALQTAVPRACNVVAKRGRPPRPVRRLGAFAQRGRAHCAFWATCREQFGLLFAQSVRRIVPQRWTYVEEVAGIMDNVTELDFIDLNHSY